LWASGLSARGVRVLEENCWLHAHSCVCAQHRREENKKRYRAEGKETARREAKKQKSMQ
jgi:hypothetical protein